MKSKRKPRESHKVLPTVTEQTLGEFPDCQCSACKVRVGVLKEPVVRPAWVTTPGYGEWNPKTQTYSDTRNTPQMPLENRQKAVSEETRAKRLAGLVKARAARSAKRKESTNE